MSKSCLVLLLLAVVTVEFHAIPVEKSLVFRPISANGDSWTLNANSLVDQVVEMFKSELPNTQALPEIHHNFQLQMWIEKVNISYHLWNGQISGIQSVRRTGNVEVTYDDTSKEIEIEASLGAKLLTASYSGHAELGKFRKTTISPQIAGTIPNLAISVKACGKVVAPMILRVCGMKISAGQAQLEIYRVKMFNVLADKFINTLITNVVLNKVQPQIIKLGEKALRKMLNKYFKKNAAGLTQQIQDLVPINKERKSPTIFYY